MENDEENNNKEIIDDEEIEEEIMADLDDLESEIDEMVSGEEESEGEEEEKNIESEIPSDNSESRELDEISENVDSIENELEGEVGEEEEIENDEEEEEISEEEQQSLEIDAHSKLKNVVEAALFVAGRPVSLEELNIKTEIKKRELEELLNELMMDYLERATSLEIIQIQDKYSLQIKPEYTPDVKKFASGGLIPDRILKTLTIIALKQPLLKSTLIKIRGSGAYEHVKFLLDRGFIQTRKKGRSDEIMTTDQFSDTFGLSRDLDTLKKQLIVQLGVSETQQKE